MSPLGRATSSVHLMSALEQPRRKRMYHYTLPTTEIISDKNAGHRSEIISLRYTHKVLQTIQMKLILSCVWAERAVLCSAKTVWKFKYIWTLNRLTKIQCMGPGISLKSERNNPWFKPWFNILLHTQPIVCASVNV